MSTALEALLLMDSTVVDVKWGIEKNNTVWGKKLAELI
jgi:hypothetical protein